ncbi:MAG TPA: pilin [Pilimelia sp.]|nr:pilin [Pilimelia sp.]
MNHVESPGRTTAPRRRPARRPGSRPGRRWPGPVIRATRIPLAALLTSASIALLMAATPQAAHAADTEPVVLAVESVEAAVNNIRLWLMGILGAWASLCLTVGFLRYTSGEPGEVEKGKLALRSAAIGYAGALIVPLLLTIVGRWVA